MSKPWGKYEIHDTEHPDITSFNVLYHVAHLDDAYVISSNGVINAGLIRDVSLLNDTRICVVWTSPNDWSSRGYIYGRVSFYLPVDRIFGDRYFYWVEEMTDYNPTALRILVSRKKIRDTRIIQFDPSEKGNPIFVDKRDRWCRLAEYNYEFMVAQDIDLDGCYLIEFVDHHPYLCNKYGSRCSELGKKWLDASHRFVCYVLGMNDLELAKIVNPEFKIQRSLSNAIVKIGYRFSSNCNGKHSLSKTVARAIIQNALLSIAHGRDGSANCALRGLDIETANEALQYLIKRTFGIDINKT